MYLGQELAGLLGLAGLPQAASLSGAVVLLVTTVVQMVFGEPVEELPQGADLARWRA